MILVVGGWVVVVVAVVTVGGGGYGCGYDYGLWVIVWWWIKFGGE